MGKITHPEVHYTEVFHILDRLMLKAKLFTLKAKPLERRPYWKVEIEQ